MPIRSLLTATCLLGTLTATIFAQNSTDPGIDFFEKNIRPVLSEKCYKCHSEKSEKLKGNLLLDTREGARRGGDSGHAVVPGNLEESLLISAIRYTDKDLQMPPEKTGGKLPENVIRNFEEWIKMGAPDPRDGPAPVAKKQIDPEKAKEFWAFQIPKKASPPAVNDTNWPRTDVDRFILAALESQKLHPVADADRLHLIRRVYFDLVGLPPKPEEVDAFLKDQTPNALETVVDRLLASPQFGESWSRHWLDVARYAESTGKERNFTYPTAWRYRDYVIASFNADKPYDQFIREQIAGDLLPAKDSAERNEHLVATGFLAVGPKGLNEKNPQQFRMDLIDEQIDATSRAVLGLTVACARCHDHKFDPIAQKDYYAIAGIFRSSSTHFGTEPLGGKNKNATTLLTLSAGESTPAKNQTIPSNQPAKQTTLDQRVAAFIADHPERAKKYASFPPARQAQMRARIAERLSGGAGPDTKPANAVPPAAPRKAPDSNTLAMGVVEGNPSNCRILVRGELDQPGDSVPRGFVSVLTNGTTPTIPQNTSGRRELADWLVAPGNPLTARVMVNRVWTHLFGQGLVRTGDNFGASGEKPSHPELLDHLAAQFSDPNGYAWSVKKLIRALVLSRTYQLASSQDQRCMDVDPDNRLLWRATPRRLDAEAIRDAMLAASGQLDPTPAEGSFVATVGDGNIGRGIRPTSFTDYESRKRSIYLPIVRDFVPEALDLFDFAEPSLVVAARDVTNVPAQALFLMNNPFVRQQSAAFAQRILASPFDYPQRIRLAYQLALSRGPSESELKRAQDYLLGEARGLIPSKDGSKEAAAVTAWSTFCQALFACAEFRYLR